VPNSISYFAVDNTHFRNINFGGTFTKIQQQGFLDVISILKHSVVESAEFYDALSTIAARHAPMVLVLAFKSRLNG
jgi:hypothetical protein